MFGSILRIQSQHVQSHTLTTSEMKPGPSVFQNDTLKGLAQNPYS